MVEVGDAMIQSRKRRHSDIMFHHFRESASLNPAGIADGCGEPGTLFMPGGIALHFSERHGQASRPVLITGHSRDIEAVF